MVSSLVMKLPIDHHQDWVKWSTTGGEELFPGENEWPAFLLWLAWARKTALKGRVYEDTDTKRAPTRAPPAKPWTMELLNAQDGEYVDSWEVNAAYGGQTYQEAYEAEARIRGVCPDCKVMHVWEHKKRTGGTEMWPSDQFRNCPKFLELTPADKAAQIEQARGCPKCTSWRHGPQNCRNPRETICKMAVGNGVCDKPHLNMLH